ncbi:MAG TPA: HNH endonuclease [Candidatus Baltobacteraceae bacterium]|nr:HNH endonuclease [Candidatus Baltobacteraceae bacterium]
MGKRVWNWSEIQRYHDEGHSFVECQRHFGFSHTAWVKAIKRGALRSVGRKYADGRRKYDWTAVQAYYDAGNSFTECKRRFGFCNASWHKARERGEIIARPYGMSIEALLSGRRNRHHLKVRLLRAGLLKNECSQCGLTEWRGAPLSMHIDHINGSKHDHRLENLRMLCPNCHSQTETYGGRNAKRNRRLQDRGPSV